MSDMGPDTACLSRVLLPGQIKLINCGRGVSQRFGMGVALSHDGRTALVSEPGAALFFFPDDAGVWKRQQAIVQDARCTRSGLDADCEGGFGIPVALSSDANVALMGSFYRREIWHNPTRSEPIANVFVRDAGGSWNSEKSRSLFIPNGNTQDTDHALALSRDGSTVLGSASGTSNSASAVWRDRTDYPRTMTATSPLERVSLSGDGNTALLGSAGTLESSVNGSAYVFVRDPQGNWTQQQQLTAGDAAVADRFGSAVAISEDGKTVLVTSLVQGAPAAAYVFERSPGGTWFQVQKMLLDSQAGREVVATEAALSRDGTTALISTVVDTGAKEYCGSVAWYVKARSGAYSKRSELVAYDSIIGDQFGTAVALSGDGHTALIGAPRAFDLTSSSYGAAYLFSLQ
ncbi:hypothetical protein BVG81_007380 [Haliangium sp. UPWRP_2]|nr:hypothetical protein BVG81_007380 [Haliangium sp. UPWRP_2]